jgi:hypothetical protein
MTSTDTDNSQIQGKSESEHAGSNTKTITLAALAGAVLSQFVTYVLYSPRIDELEYQNTIKPPVAVVDFMSMAREYPAGATDEQLNAGIQRANQAIRDLESAGYLILDAAHIVAAPQDIYLPPDIVREP